MHSIHRFAIGLGLAAGLTLPGLAPAAAAEFVYGSWPPAGEYMNRITLPAAFEQIDKATNGEVTWKLIPGGQIANPKTTFDAIQNGLMQAGLGISTYVPNMVPSLNTIYSTVVFGDEVVAASAAALETLTLDCPSCLEEFKNINIVPLSGWIASPYVFACTTPVKSLADLKGKRVRATGGNVALAEMIGAVPVSATLVEAVTLLQRGGLDCQFGIVGWLKAFGYADFAKHVLDYPLGMTGPAVGMMMNRDSWDGLTPEQKTAHLRAAAYISAEQVIGQFIVENAEIKKEVAEKNGVEFVVPTDTAAFDEIATKYETAQREKNVADAKGFGVENPEAIIDAYDENRKKWSELAKDVGNDVQKLADLYWQEIYSKVDVGTF